jgi:hypothetical protein
MSLPAGNLSKHWLKLLGLKSWTQSNSVEPLGRSSKHVLQDLIAQGRLALTPGLRTECDLLMALPEFSLFEEMLKLRLDGEVPACCEREPDLKRAARAMIERSVHMLYNFCSKLHFQI